MARLASDELQGALKHGPRVAKRPAAPPVLSLVHHDYINQLRRLRNHHRTTKASKIHLSNPSNSLYPRPETDSGASIRVLTQNHGRSIGATATADRNGVYRSGERSV
ncbi:hypothetical protein BHE74_00036816 [Ensete ventricosum]|uniref:Uncharacterized protein n=1 Tax=Ensete ventricosum TaxID=4639 RepID=A0A426Y2J9_ENSVE|nr:hypothetical protein B296_00047166 [Ensete ventricosum]RWW56465.1 hypothetical protein BHE74_00036816 [Ensete ventricosum]RZR86894.1 hypothetical protein BHM03_00014192 [Ensete ventricosum]